MNNVETSVVAFTVSNHTDTTHVVTSGNHGDDTSVELDEVDNLAGGKVNLDGVVDLDIRVWVADASSRSVCIQILEFCQQQVQSDA